MSITDKTSALVTALNQFGTAVDGKLDTKATTTEVNTALATKADASVVKSMANRDLLTGTADPTGAQGNDGDIYLKTS